MRILRTIYILTFSILFFYSINFSQTIDFSKPDTIEEEIINNSIKHYKYIYKSIPWSINIIEADLSINNFYFLSIKGFDRIFDSREKVSEIVKRLNKNGEKILAAINADFFNMSNGDVENNQISSGEFVKGITSKRSQIAFTSTNEPFINIFNFSGNIQKNNKEYLIDAINSNRGIDSIVIYNHYWGNSTNTNAKGIEYTFIPIDSIKINHSFRAKIIAKYDSNSTINNNYYVLSVSGNKKDILSKIININDTIIVNLNITPTIYDIKELLGGLPQIIKNGQNIAHLQALNEGASEKFSITRHPRSAIGFDKDKKRILLLTVDGRQKNSAGMTLNELAEFMLNLNCYEALNFDGGGSTTLVVKDKIVNSPSDITGERAVGNALLIISK